MILELFLLVAVLLFMPLAAGNMFLLLMFAVTVICCLPVVRLVLQKAPPFVPTPKGIVETMVRLADIKPGQKIYDLGCGDGRLLRAAARRGAAAVGYELSIPTLLLARLRSWKTPNVQVRYADFWKKDYRDADVIFCYLLIQKMRTFEEKIWPTLAPGTRVVSHAFTMPTVPVSKREGDAVLYVKD